MERPAPKMLTDESKVDGATIFLRLWQKRVDAQIAADPIKAQHKADIDAVTLSAVRAKFDAMAKEHATNYRIVDGTLVSVATDDAGNVTYINKVERDGAVKLQTLPLPTAEEKTATGAPRVENVMLEELNGLPAGGTRVASGKTGLEEVDLSDLFA